MSMNFISENSKYVFNTYGRTPIMLVSGSGTKVWDSTGKEYLDFIGGLAACSLGHGHSGLQKAISDQAGKLIHVSNIFHIEPQIELAKLLTAKSFADKAFFCNSGAEANEGAIKLARKYFHDRQEHDRYHVVTMENSFHGRTLATLAATGQTKYRKGFEPDVDGFSHVPFGDFSALQDSVRDNTAAIMLELIQGEGGVRVADKSYFQEVRRFCDSTGCLLIFDEVQTGMGRTGNLFAYELFDVEPDIMTLAKGIAGGVPMGAVLAKDTVASAFVPGTHASTFGGNPLSSAAALYVMGQITSPEFLENVKSKGAYLHNQLNRVRHDFSVVKDVRGFGLMQAIELSMPGAEIVSELRNCGILVNCTSDTVLRFLPPLIVTEQEIDTMIAVLRSVLQGKGDLMR